MFRKKESVQMSVRVSNPYFNLKSFEGPLDLLLHLIENKELDVYEIVIGEVMDQYLGYLNTLMEYDLDLSAEFLSVVSSLMLLKSKMLLPKHEEKEQIDESTLRVDIIEQLIHYYKFKNIAQELRDKEEAQKTRFNRGFCLTEAFYSTELKKPSSESLLSELFVKVLEKSRLKHKDSIEEEDYRVQDMIQYWKQAFKDHETLNFHSVFNLNEPKLKLITLFLALLELLKNGLAKISLQENQLIIEGIR
ncbi:MAG: Segregation and condensation protein A [Chlamydiae bacterium]|nr:Segregation and condensation protein A [Chlamydiota bacterium]